MDAATKLIFALDASAPGSALALGRYDASNPLETAEFLAGDERIDGANQASQTLGERICDVFERAGVELADVDLIACGCGPGTFTGTRVALATAQGLAAGLKCDTVSLSTLDALAWSHPKDAALVDGTVLLSLLDARRGEIYGRAYQKREHEWEALTDPVCTEIGVFLAGLPAGPRVALGPGVEPYLEALPPGTATLSAEERLMGPSARGLWRASCAAFARDGAHPVTELRPMYLRATYAELGINKPKRAMFKSPFV